MSAAFREQNAGKDLREVHPDPQRAGNLVRGTLHARTRQALASVEEVKVLKLVCRMNKAELRLWAEGENVAKKLAAYVT